MPCPLCLVPHALSLFPLLSHHPCWNFLLQEVFINETIVFVGGMGLLITAPTMPTSGVKHEFKMLFAVLEFFDQLQAVLHVHIVIHGAMVYPE